jgi:hypothetical protein
VRSRCASAASTVRQRHADFLRAGAGEAIGIASDAHEAAHGLDHCVVAGAIAFRSRLSEAGDRAVDQAGVELLQRRVVQAEAREPTDLEVLEQHVGALRETTHQGLTLFACDVDGDGFLAAVCREEICGLRSVVSVEISEEGRAPAPGVVTAVKPLDLDHLGPEVGENLGRPRTREDPAQIQHAYV